MKLVFNVPKYGDGDLDAFVNKPFVHYEQAIGIVEKVEDKESYYELTVLVWDQFTEVVPSFLDGKLSSVSFKFK